MSILQELTSSAYNTSELKAIQSFLLAESKTLSDLTLKTWLGTGENQIAKRAAALLDDDLEALYAYYKSKPRPKDTVGEMRYAAIMSAYKKRHHITEAQDGELSVGDTVEVSGNVQFQDCVGEVESLHGGFVAVKIYSSNSTHSFHASDLRKIDDDHDHGDDGDNEDEYDGGDGDESFFVVIHDSDENKSFIGEFEKDGGRWREHVVSGKPPYAWGGRFMSYLSAHEIMSMLTRDFKHYEVEGPFDSKEEAVEFVHGNHGHDTLKESEELKALGRNIKKGKKPPEDELPPANDELPPEDGETPPVDDEASTDEPAPEDGDVPADDELPADDAAPTDEPPADEEPETTTADTDTVSADAVTPEFKVGDVVKPNKGQHAGEPHEVVGIHPDGGLLIKPQGLDDQAIKYTAKSKTAKIRTDDVAIVESQQLKRGLLKAVTETRVDNGALTMPELLKLRNGLYEAGDMVGYRVLVQAITEAKSGGKPRMKEVEGKLAAHAKSKGDREAKYGTLSPGDQVSHEQTRTRLLKDLSRERSKANCSEGKVGDFVAKVKRGAEATQKARGEAAKIWGSKDEDEAKKHVKNSNRYSNLGTERSGKSDYVPPKSALTKLAGAVMGHPTGAPKYKVGDTVSYEMSPGQEKGRGTSKIVKLGKDYHYALENGAYVNQTEIKKVVKEGIMDLFKGKEKPKDRIHSREITDDERAMISRYFPSNNAKLRDLSDKTKPLFPTNVHASLGVAKINFYVKNDKLVASVAWHSSSSDAGNPNKRPLTHFDVDINGEEDLRKLKKEINGNADTHGHYDESIQHVGESADKKLFRISCTDDKGGNRSMLLHAADEAACKAHCEKKGYKLKKVKDVTGEEAPPTRKVREGLGRMARKTSLIPRMPGETDKRPAADRSQKQSVKPSELKAKADKKPMKEEHLDEVSNALVAKAKLAGLDKSKALQAKVDKEGEGKYGSQRKPAASADKAEFERLHKFNLAAEKRLNKGNKGPSEEEQHKDYNRKRATGGVGLRKD
jgi:hypothetical protein